jgi:regulatory protein
MNKRPLPPQADHPASPESIKAEGGHGQGSAAKTAKKPPKKITETYISNAGAYYLQRYAASTARFRSVMTRKIDTSCRHHADQNRDQCLDMLERVIARFQDLGYLNDDSYTRMKVSSLLQRGLSRRMILLKLQNAGIPEAGIKAALGAHFSEHGITAEDSELAAALKLARKKRLGPHAPDKNGDHKRAMTTLARAGFSFDVIKRVLNTGPDEFDPPAD